MKRLLITSLAAALLVSAQKIETQKTDRTRITRLETALNHLTVIEVGEPIEQVAAGSSEFKVEWRGNKVFIEPLEADAATNLFIWTQTGNRLNYEIVPAASVERMHFATGTPYEAVLGFEQKPGERVLAPEITATCRTSKR